MNIEDIIAAMKERLRAMEEGARALRDALRQLEPFGAESRALEAAVLAAVDETPKRKTLSPVKVLRIVQAMETADPTVVLPATEWAERLQIPLTTMRYALTAGREQGDVMRMRLGTGRAWKWKATRPGSRAVA